VLVVVEVVVVVVVLVLELVVVLVVVVLVVGLVVAVVVVEVGGLVVVGDVVLVPLQPTCVNIKSSVRAETNNSSLFFM
jgi:hypothetical protein